MSPLKTKNKRLLMSTKEVAVRLLYTHKEMGHLCVILEKFLGNRVTSKQFDTSLPTTSEKLPDYCGELFDFSSPLRKG